MTQAGRPHSESDDEAAPNPSPDFSSRRSPRRSPRGSPIRTPRSLLPDLSTLNPHRLKIEIHPILDGTPCDLDGFDVPVGSDPPPRNQLNDFFPFEQRADFEFAEFLYKDVEMSAGKIDRLLELLAALYPERTPHVADHKELYAMIDSIKQGDVAWDSFSVQYNGVQPSTDAPRPLWMGQTYEVWFRDPLKILENQIGNADFKGEMDYAPKRVFHKGKRRYQDLMSGNWAWEQADKIAQDDATHGAMFALVVLGSDKTTVLVATGQNDYYPLYVSLGNVHNSVRRAHRNALSLLGFLAVPKTTRDYADKANFRKFRRQLFHSSLEHILSSLRPHMIHPRITRCADGHYRRVIYGLGPYIADYPEQALLACIVQNWCPKCTALPEDLDAKGAIPRTHVHTDILVNSGGVGIKELWDDYGIVGDLIVYLPAIAGHVPKQMVQAVASLIEFCYLVRRNVIDEDTLSEIENTLTRFYEHREIFREVNVRPDGFSLPRQHSLKHYPFLITQFGAPNGLCSSITESKHIKAVKCPYRRSSRNKPLGQMLVTNQRLDKLAAARVDFAACGMLNGPSVVGPLLDLALSRYPHSDPITNLPQPASHLPPQSAPIVNRDEELEDTGIVNDVVDEPESYSEITLAKTYVRKLPRDMYALAQKVQQAQLPLLMRRFLYDSLHPTALIPSSRVPQDELPQLTGKAYIYTSARAVFYAPSDLSGLGGLRHERIRSTKSWYGGAPRRDCIFVGNSDASDAPGMRGLLVARVLLFFSFTHSATKYPCALVHWFSIIGDEPCDETGMWIVEPDFRGGKPFLEVIHLDAILRGAHLIGVSGSHFLPNDLDFTFDKSLDAFSSFYVNKYVDHQAHEIAF
ncbi:hypothetical protein NLJ89_g4545 [Agrocybe chaxingu]|uniref:Uncharacterized protein n=1 Tax=Agrocybe chaxingu TaxID=84603 RepID=A0A9W8MUG2_9AGAR|nr:hypothetical protein NLJ89_g4545 [Agrocybe chaxingu]